MSKPEKQLIADQTKLIERTRKAVEFHRELAKLCDAAGLPILAREHDFVAREMEGKIALQMRAFRDGALVGKTE